MEQGCCVLERFESDEGLSAYAINAGVTIDEDLSVNNVLTQLRSRKFTRVQVWTIISTHLGVLWLSSLLRQIGVIGKFQSEKRTAIKPLLCVPKDYIV